MHELGACSGGKDIVRFKLVGALRQYSCVYTQKPLMDSGAHKAGAGVMLLFKRELFREEVMNLPPNVEKPLLLDGHIRTVCLWRKQYLHLPPLVVTVAYIPPPVRSGMYAEQNRELRSEGLSAIPKIVDYLKARGDSHHIIVAHVNASDGCIDLKTRCRTQFP